MYFTKRFKFNNYRRRKRIVQRESTYQPIQPLETHAVSTRTRGETGRAKTERPTRRQQLHIVDKDTRPDVDSDQRQCALSEHRRQSHDCAQAK